MGRNIALSGALLAVVGFAFIQAFDERTTRNALVFSGLAFFLGIALVLVGGIMWIWGL